MQNWFNHRTATKYDNSTHDTYKGISHSYFNVTQKLENKEQNLTEKMDRSRDKRLTQTNISLIETFRRSQISFLIRRENFLTFVSISSGRVVPPLQFITSYFHPPPLFANCPCFASIFGLPTPAQIPATLSPKCQPPLPTLTPIQSIQPNLSLTSPPKLSLHLF